MTQRTAMGVVRGRLLLPLTQASAGLRERINQRDASGFIRLNALRLRIQAKKKTGLEKKRRIKD